MFTLDSFRYVLVDMFYDLKEKRREQDSEFFIPGSVSQASLNWTFFPLYGDELPPSET